MSDFPNRCIICGTLHWLKFNIRYPICAVCRRTLWEHTEAHTQVIEVYRTGEYYDVRLQTKDLEYKIDTLEDQVESLECDNGDLEGQLDRIREICNE